MVIFVYGTDYQRQFNNNLLSKLTLFMFNWTSLFVILASIFLCFVRRIDRLRRAGFMPVLIDVMVMFIGGGNLRMRHTLEKWFFVVVSIGAFFLNAICFDSTSFPSYLLSTQSVETFQQLTEINPPIYFNHLLKSDEKLIHKMLRFV